MEAAISRTAIGFSAVVLAACLASASHATDALQSSGPATVVSGGVGENAREQLAQQTRGHELKLVFAATPSGAYLADVPVTISDQRGRKVLEHTSQGPWMFVDLPAGSYTVEARLGDQVQSRKVSVQQGRQKTIHFRWSEKLDDVTVHTAGR